jgi:hypothetical protein
VVQAATSKSGLLACAALLSACLTACGAAKTAVDPAAPPALRAISVVGCDAGLRLEFVGDLDPKTVTSKAFSVERAPGVTAYDLAGRAVTFVPDEPFTSGQTYSAVLSGDIASIGGTPMGASMRWSFSCFDQTPPVVMERFPQGEGLSLLVRPTVRFSKPIDEKSLTAENLKIDGHSATISYSPAERTATLNPTYPLYPGRKYTVTVSPRVRDLSGNELGVTVTWSFRTRPAADDWAVKMITPPIPSMAACDSPLEFRLSQDFQLNASGLQSSPVAIDGVPNLTVSYDAQRRVVKVSPTNIPFRPGLTYQLLATSALLDKEGDTPFDAGAVVGSFAMASKCDEPTVAEVPAYAGLLDCEAPVLVRFSAPMAEESTVPALQLRDLTAGGFDVESSPLVSADVALSTDGYTASVQPQSALLSGHRYWVSVTTDAQSQAGKSLTAGGGWEFVAICP